ncbi:ABC transporter permease [Cryptosporangium arvum]|uniref:Permease component of ribose/xylose/arabinose/galactoside ABC-type transporter n=1 Tax=Cryptosporangium arvum DSM 44712 TaxID=927661 RepID=A0A010YZM0_9ACTN|nr:ABC transporter permease [Cryptosporangium arvum]EXG80653.1 permease component of ribose/xylose/arabinose/galactoside ABC-type transporter [Cryptosporangium arvum DSM 44712]
MTRLRRLGLWLVLATVTLLLAIASPTFRTVLNAQNVLEQTSLLGIVACGMAVMMISGGFDLSVGAVGASASVVGAIVAAHVGGPLTLVAGLLVGLALGFANGYLIAKVRINAFVATFAMSNIVSGVLFTVTDAQSHVGAPALLTTAATGRVLGVPTLFLVFVAVLAATWFVLTRTKFGHYVYSVGGNAEASHLSGVPVQRVQIFAFATGGVLAGAAGLLLLGQTQVGQPSAAQAWPLNAIAICVVGGVALTGGVGRIEDVFAATLLLGVIANGLNQLNVSPYWQPAITGLVILVAVVLDQYNRRRTPGRRAGNPAEPSRPTALVG